MVLISLCEVKGSFLVLVHKVEFTALVNQKLAHFELSLSSCVEETGLSVLIEVVDVDSMSDQ